VAFASAASLASTSRWMGNGSINACVDARLKEIGEAMRRFGRRPKGETQPEKSEGAEETDDPAREPQSP